MDNYQSLALIIAAIVIIYVLNNIRFSVGASKKSKREKKLYVYDAKPSIMSPAEREFFKKLDRAVSGRYYTFPQIHLSAVLGHTIKGQDWNAAFRHINGKSVDYVLCSKEDLRPAYAIELDDYTHDRKDRTLRDTEVERIFSQANIPLVRFKNKNVSEAEIIETLSKSRRII